MSLCIHDNIRSLCADCNYGELPEAEGRASLTNNEYPNEFLEDTLANEYAEDSDKYEFSGHPDQIQPYTSDSCEYDAIATARMLNNTAVSDKLEDFIKSKATYSALAPTTSTEALEVATKIQQKNIKKNNKFLNAGPAQLKAINAQKARVSRRLLLATRSTQCTVVCPISGIVSLMDLPVIPGAALELEHPLGILANARGIAQQGIEYLRKLDTQVLAGIFIVLAEKYELIKFQPFDSGAQKNAILRTAGKDQLIDAIIMVEDTVNSGNYQFLPKLSLVADSELMTFGVSARFESYVTMLAEAIAKPDTEAYDENAKPKKIGRPVYIRDVVKQQNTISFLARKEVVAAKVAFKEDKKAGKALVSKLYSEGKIRASMRNFFAGLFADDSLLAIPEESIGLILMRIADIPEMEPIATIVKKDRKILTLDITEVEEMFTERDIVETQDNDSIEDDEDEEIDLEDAFQSLHEPTVEEVVEAAMPEGLSTLEQILWKKKNTPQKRNIVQNTAIPSVATYTKPAESRPNAGVSSLHYSADRQHMIGELDNNKRIYFVVDDMGRLIAPKFFPHTEVGE